MKKILVIPATAFLAIMICFQVTSCKKEAATAFGTITGTVYSKNGKHTISGALVYADSKTSGYSTRSATDGKFSLRVPVGPHIIYIETGEGDIFRSTVTATAVEGKVIDLPANETKLDQEAQLAFVSGIFDAIEAIVRDSLGYTVTEIYPTDFDNLATLQQYAGIFVNCGASQLSTQGYANLGKYAETGSLYVSDFASEYLLGQYDYSCAAPGGFIDDTKLCFSRTGTTGTISGATIESVSLQNYMGVNQVDLEYDLCGWSMVSNYDPNMWEVMISDASNGPLLIHTPAVVAKNNVSGYRNIYFTTFHNQPAGGISNTAEQILTYVILNL